MDVKQAAFEVTRYLVDCEAWPEISRKHHPTPGGAVQVIYCRTAADKELVQAALLAARPDLAKPETQRRERASYEEAAQLR
jgi:hypothetical protein